jgi:acyl-phosphate glycerol 3-phosphate acyltransferase
LVFALDFLKGAIPAGTAAWWRGGADAVAIAAGLAAVLGHMFSAFLGGRGGKGVATGAGVVVVLLPAAAGLAAVAFLAVLLSGTVMSIAAVVAAVVLALAQFSLEPSLTDAGTWFAAVVALLVVARHRSNLARLSAGAEPKIQGLVRFQHFTPAAHAVAVGLWCGAGWFFSLGVAPRIFATFDRLVEAMPPWLPIVDNTDRDLASRLAGTAVAPAFGPYFALQAVCGLVAAGTALGWSVADRGRRTRIRAIVLPVAVLLVGLGWPVVTAVNATRLERFASDPVISEAARSAFARWHTLSLILNLGALALATPALALAAYPPRFDTGDDPPA